jgi:hypothetical protein
MRIKDWITWGACMMALPIAAAAFGAVVVEDQRFVDLFWWLRHLVDRIL